MAVAAAVTSLCVDCIAEETRLPAARVVVELHAINEARQRRERPTIGPLSAPCQRCEAPKLVYRLAPR